MVVIPALNAGGTELHIASIMPQLAEKGFDICVAAISAGGPVVDVLRSRRIRVLEPASSGDREGITRSRQGRPVSGTFGLVKDLRQRPVDIVHSFLPLAYLAGSFAAWITKTPITVMSRRNLNLYQKRYPGMARIERYLHRRTSYILGNSNCVARELLTEGAPSERVGVIYNGIDAVQTDADIDRSDERADLDIPDDALVLTIVANLISYKGHADLIDALGAVSEQMPAGWVLQVVGRDDGLGPGLKARANSLGLAAHVRFLGQRTDISKLLRLSDIGLLVSHEEGFSNAVLEGMAASLPMIVTDVGGNAEAVIDGENGYVVPAHDTDRLGRAIVKLAGDAGLRQELGRAGRRRITDIFSQAACVEKYCGLYDALLEGRVPDFSIARTT